jgi:hypothetical protein
MIVQNFSETFWYWQHAGNALAQVQWVHKPADLWDITFLRPMILRILVICAHANFEAQSSHL